MFEGMTNASELSEKKLPLKDNYFHSNQKLYSTRTILSGNSCDFALVLPKADYCLRMTQDSNLSQIFTQFYRKIGP